MVSVITVHSAVVPGTGAADSPGWSTGSHSRVPPVLSSLGKALVQIVSIPGINQELDAPRVPFLPPPLLPLSHDNIVGLFIL